MMVEQGIEFASAAQIGRWIKCRTAEVPHRLRGARQAQEMVCVTRQGWVPSVNDHIQPQAFMEPMMRHFGHRYYLAGLSAAARHGASHQALQVDHFATDGHLSNRTIRGMARVEMFHRPNVEAFPTVAQQAMSWTGHLQPITVSTAEVALFDLFALHSFRGCDAKETVACELLDLARICRRCLTLRRWRQSRCSIRPQHVSGSGSCFKRCPNTSDAISISARWKRHFPTRRGP